jgi:tartrate-resistant acid phosphatase type 5
VRKGLLLVLAFTTACGGRQAGPVLSPEAFKARGDATDICEDLRSPGAPPSIKPADQAVSVLAFGDFGDGVPQQMTTARSMVQYSQAHPFDFGITLGDNFYPQGLANPTDSRWNRDWETPYGPLGVRFYATLGNHDYYNAASPAGEIERSNHSQSWCLPRHFYTYTAGPVQFFAIDTDPIERDVAGIQTQLDWLKRALRSSQAPWKVVYGHHPVYTNGEHGGSLGYLSRLRAKLLPILKEAKVDVYLAGHDHDLEALKPDEGISFFVSGGGGKEKRPLRTNGCRAWAESTYGFTVLEAEGEEMTVRFLGSDGQELHKTTWKKGEAPEDCRRGS